MEEHDRLLPTALQQLASRSRLQWGSWLEAVVSVVLQRSYKDFLINLGRNLQNVGNFVGVTCH
jgi:hypothetical protein